MTQSPECMLSTLNLSTLELSKLANFDAALHDANIMQQTLPSSALGYIRAATIYSEQGKQLQVINVCTKGLSLADKNDAHYDTLQHAKDVAMQRQNKRIDFISQLPVEIVVTRLIPLFMDDDLLDSGIPNAYIHVSNVWRDRIHECFGGLRFMVVVKEDRKEQKCSQLIQFAQHTKALVVTWYSQGTWLSDLLRENDFCMLRELRINGYANVHDTGILSSLSSINNTLTHLYITLNHVRNILPTADIVSACPNLVTMRIANSFDADFSSLPMTTWPNMKTLSITQARKRISSDQVVAISKRFPSLERLTLSPCADGHSALVLPQYCSSIRDILIRTNEACVQLDCHQGHSCDEQGVKAIYISGFFSTTYSVQDGIRLLQQYNGGLKHLVWDMGCDTNDEALYNIEYPCLSKLVLKCSGWWIPRNAPVLQELEIMDTVIRGNPNVLDTIPPHLKKLKMRLAPGALPTYSTSIERYLHRLAQQTQLTELVVYFYNIVNFDSIAKVLDAICGFSQLGHLMVGFSDSWDGKQMEQFLEQLAKGCPLLSCLEIRSRNAPSASSMNALKRLESLQHMAFSINGTNDDDKFWNTIQTFSQLKCIRVYPPVAVNKNYITRVKQQRPDMKIVITKILLMH
ncbi:hypothetical protein O0I10_006659 [Lichtheimia ornata]|uniref:F-box domain-containing protein n=1 Tax=Lichtheimia ornata TaxID=688661 RepID=A0AAD7V2F9_9FUNG|nr:uncharacterized protein O0I10_006659 [Lichtheimia ornata]KAJ8657595.1 hypothetical protein O0I10_006659 [Lichtheimia ornata]